MAFTIGARARGFTAIWVIKIVPRSPTGTKNSDFRCYASRYTAYKTPRITRYTSRCCLPRANLCYIIAKESRRVYFRRGEEKSRAIRRRKKKNSPPLVTECTIHAFSAPLVSRAQASNGRTRLRNRVIIPDGRRDRSETFDRSCSKDFTVERFLRSTPRVPIFRTAKAS